MILLNLKTALVARKVKQVDLAISLGISPTVISEIVNGRRVADARLRSLIAKDLCVDEEWLFRVQIDIPSSRGVAIGTSPETSYAVACSGRVTT